MASQKFFIQSLAVTALTVVSSSGALISIAPANVTASTEIPNYDRKDDYLVDNSGLSGGAHDDGANGMVWLSTGTNYGGDDLDPYVMFDLGAVYTISSIHVWNYNENAGGNQMTRGVNGVSVQYGIMAELGSTVASITNFTIADGTPTYTGQDFSGFAAFNARYIKFDINSNHGDANNFYGLSEVQFDGALIPEPGLGILAAVSVIALAWHRRR